MLFKVPLCALRYALTALKLGYRKNTSRSLFTAGSRSLTDFISALILSNICFLPFSENKNALVCITDEGDISITVPLRFGAYTPFMSLTQTTRAEILISLTFPLPTRIKNPYSRTSPQISLPSFTLHGSL